MKLLEYLLQHELVPDARTGRGLILAGKVLVDDRPVSSEKAEVDESQSVRLKARVSGDVSRGAAKLRPALAAAIALDPAFDPRGRCCLDLGASTGGFTQVLLEVGAASVYCVDVGYGILDSSLRNDPRVTVLERTNVRLLNKDMLAQPASLVLGDLSFISWSAALPAIVPLLAADAGLLLLLKPQFELAAQGRGDELQRGVAVDTEAVRECLAGLYNLWTMHHLGVVGLFPAGLRGAQGNQEYFIALVRGKPGLSREQYEQSLAAAQERSAG